MSAPSCPDSRGGERPREGLDSLRSWGTGMWVLFQLLMCFLLPCLDGSIACLPQLLHDNLECVFVLAECDLFRFGQSSWSAASIATCPGKHWGGWVVRILLPGLAVASAGKGLPSLSPARPAGDPQVCLSLLV